MKYRSSIFSITFLVINFSFLISRAQFYNLPNEYSFSLLTERELAAKDSSVHSSVKPYIHFYSEKYKHVADSHPVFKYITEDPFLDRVFRTDLIGVSSREKKFSVKVDPILNFEFGRDSEDTIRRSLYTNTRGFIASGSLGKDFYFETMLVENQSVFPNYIESYNRALGIVPGQGRWKAFKSRGFDYTFSSGFFSYQPCKNINIQAGHGKQKIGQGYRSLFLSDNAFNYPYVRITQQYFKGRVQYTNIYASLMNLVSASEKIVPNTERLFQKKAASFQHLSINFTKWFNLGFFQGLMWQVGDKNNVQHFEWQYFNPVIYTNLGFYGLNNRNNILAGSELNLKLTNRISLYAQAIVDDLSNTRVVGNGFGYQAGIKYFNAFKVKNLFLQAEYNEASESAYTSPITDTSNQSFSHFNQNIAYSPGNGRELTGILDYKFQRICFNARYSYQSVTVFNKEFYLNQYVNLKLGYTINPAYNANISIGLLYRNQDYLLPGLPDNKTAYVYLSFKTSLFNSYYDF